MTITHNYDGSDYVVYTDGTCFVDVENYNKLPGIKIEQRYTNGKPALFILKAGWWWIPTKFRMCIYNWQEIHSGRYLDITTRVNINANYFIYLEEDIRIPPVHSGIEDDVYYDITIFNEEGILEKLKKDLNILDSGNLIEWKNKIQLIDMLYA